jgi:predicted peptidase
LFSSDITYSYEYVANGEVMNYALFSPSTNDKNLPLIVYLHGSGEVWGNPANFPARGIIPVMENWTLEGFNAYVLSPHLTGDFGYQYWGSEFCETNLRNLIAWIDE